MAWSSADIPAAEVALLAADKPVMLGQNLLRDASQVFMSRDSILSLPASDDSELSRPSSLLYDGMTSARAKGNADDNQWFIHIDFGSSGVTFDSIAILNHNLWSEGTTLLRVQVFDDASYSSGAKTIYEDASFDTSRSDDRRLAFLDLHHIGDSDPQRYTTVQYLRVLITGVAGSRPEIGELIVSRRTQLTANPIDPWDPNNLESGIRQFESSSGVVTSHVDNRGRLRITPTIQEDNGDNIGELITFYQDHTEGGTKPFLWIPKPTTDPDDAYLMAMDPPDLNGPTFGPEERRFTFNAVEVGPQFSSGGI